MKISYSENKLFKILTADEGQALYLADDNYPYTELYVNPEFNTEIIVEGPYIEPEEIEEEITEEAE